MDLVKGALLALFLIYALMAIPLRSYTQPLIIMSVIPFGTIGAMVGHWILSIPVSMTSFFGIIALSGVVVNDSLILVDFVNKERKIGVPLAQAVKDFEVALSRHEDFHPARDETVFSVEPGLCAGLVAGGGRAGPSVGDASRS